MGGEVTQPLLIMQFMPSYGLLTMILSSLKCTQTLLFDDDLRYEQRLQTLLAQVFYHNFSLNCHYEELLSS